jgi:sRNA-binding carbon storage regulator CsrA
LARHLQDRSIAVTVLSIDRPPHTGLRMQYSAPSGAHVQILRANNPLAQPLDDLRPVRGIHRSLVLTRYPMETVRWFPAPGDPQEAADDLAQHAIFIHIAKIIDDRVTLRISASDKWTVLRAELERRPTRTASDDAVINAGVNEVTATHSLGARSYKALKFEQLTQLSEHYQRALTEFSAEAFDAHELRTECQEYLSRFLAAEQQISAQHAQFIQNLQTLKRRLS